MKQHEAFPTMKTDELKKIAHDLGAIVCGIAPIDRFTDAPKGFGPLDIYPAAQSVVVYGRLMPKGVLESVTNAPYTLIRNKLLDALDNISLSLTFQLEAEGFNAVPIPAAEPYDFWDNENRHGRGILSIKHAARLAGLGCIGKSTLLINKRYGNRLWLGAILTNAKFEPDTVSENLCPESCSKCIDSCPQKALDGITIHQRRCRERLSVNSEGGGFIYGCNTCIKACPFSKI